MKKITNYLLNKIGYNISKIRPYNFNHIFKKFEKKDNNVIVDVGANRGQSIENFLSIYKNYEIHCFEPLNNLYEELTKKYGQNKNIHLNNYALGEENKDGKFFKYHNDVNSSFNRPINDSKWEKKKKKILNKEKLIEQELKVKILKLDEYFKINNLKFINLLKIDTQGYEDKVLSGSNEILTSNKINFIQVEFIMGNQYENRLNIIDYENYLIKNNFRLYGINQRGDLLTKSDISLDLLYANSNYVAVK